MSLYDEESGTTIFGNVESLSLGPLCFFADVPLMEVPAMGDFNVVPSTAGKAFKFFGVICVFLLITSTSVSLSELDSWRTKFVFLGLEILSCFSTCWIEETLK